MRTFTKFLDFCYLVRRNAIDEDTLNAIDAALQQFHAERKVFITAGVRPDGISLPRQHLLSHYHQLIKLFGAPNGLCSSITESKHIKAIKKPYRRSSKHKALGQMLLTNQRLDKLAALRVQLTAHGMLDGACSELQDRFARLEALVPSPQAPPTSHLTHGLVTISASDEDNDDEAVDGEQVQAEVVLAHCHGTSCWAHQFIYIWLI